MYAWRVENKFNNQDNYLDKIWNELILKKNSNMKYCTLNIFPVLSISGPLERFDSRINVMCILSIFPYGNKQLIWRPEETPNGFFLL